MIRRDTNYNGDGGRSANLRVFVVSNRREEASKDDIIILSKYKLISIYQASKKPCVTESVMRDKVIRT